MAKSASGSTAPSFGTRSRTCPYEASTLKPLPRYFLIVRAFAGDSTITRLSAMGYWVTAPETKNRGLAADACFDPTVEGSVRIALRIIEYQIFHARVGQLLPGLAREHHQHNPLDLFQIKLFGVERQQSVNDNFALTRGQNAAGFERCQESAALGVEPHQLFGRVHTKRAAAAQSRTLALFSQIGQPVQCALDAGLAKACALQIAREGLALGARGQLFEHVAIEDVNQNVENGVIHHLRFGHLRFRPMVPVGVSRGMSHSRT